MVEAGGWRPRWQRFAAQVGETFLEADQVRTGVRVAWRYGAAGAGVAALKIYCADAEAHDAALVFAIELIFPERRQISVRACRSDNFFGCDCGRLTLDRMAIDFQRGAKALPHGVDAQAREPLAHDLQ